METAMACGRLTFYLNDAPVGRFRGRSYPTRAGRIEYMPYRGEGHMWMASALRRGESPECWFARRGKRFVFKVVREDFVLGAPGSSSNWYVKVRRPTEANVRRKLHRSHRPDSFPKQV